VSTYDLGRQPFGLASPAAWLRRAGIPTDCIDTSRERLDDERIAAASLIAFYLPMHTATRLAAPLISRAREVNPKAARVAYGLYAPLNRDWLLEHGVTHVLGPEAEADLVTLARNRESRARSLEPRARSLPRLAFIQPDRSTLPPLARYASLRMPDGTLRVMGSTDATRGCKHLCRHCPIVPVYQGAFRVIPIDVVMADVAAQVRAGARHISFGDPDFFNGPTHATRIVERMARECPGVTYDCTIKVEHLLRHARLLPVLRRTGCLFITSAVESIDDRVLERLRKGHTRADFERALTVCREAGIAVAPTFIPFTPWTTLDGYVELLNVLDSLDLVEDVAAVQLAIRLLVTAESPLLELPDIRERIDRFDPASLTWVWRHADPRVDALQSTLMQVASDYASAPRSDAFRAMAARARETAGLSPARHADRVRAAVATVTEPWYCCAEPVGLAAI
jgi:radical SAM superfamily enzyme YgiQ (UPF0313 family)